MVPTFRLADWREQGPPPVRHQHAINDDKRTCENDVAPVGTASGLPHRARIALPQQQSGESGSNEDTGGTREAT